MMLALAPCFLVQRPVPVIFFHHETDIYTNRNKTGEELKECIVIWEENKSILCEKKYENKNGRKQQYTF